MKIGWMPQPKDKDWLYGYKIKTPIYVVSEKAMAPHSSTLPGKSHGRRSLVGCSPWGRDESDTTEWLHFHFSLSRIGEGNGNPLQCLVWRIPGTGEPGGLPSVGSHRVWHDWSDLAAAAVHIHPPVSHSVNSCPFENRLSCYLLEEISLLSVMIKNQMSFAYIF